MEVSHVLGSTLLATALFFPAACSKKPVSEEQALRFAAGAMQDVLPGMIKTLQEKVTNEGAMAAVSFCREFAPSYGKEKNAEWSAKAKAELGARAFRFRRISLKNRSPKNIPDAQQADILAQWEKGEIKPVAFKREESLFTMHPIKISQPLCLSCHGETGSLDGKAAAEIKKLYPQDKATGYKMGDLRGAFVTEITP